MGFEKARNIIQDTFLPLTVTLVLTTTYPLRFEIKQRYTPESPTAALFISRTLDPEHWSTFKVSNLYFPFFVGLRSHLKNLGISKMQKQIVDMCVAKL